MQRTHRCTQVQPHKYPRLACAPPVFQLCLPTLCISQEWVSHMHDFSPDTCVCHMRRRIHGSPTCMTVHLRGLGGAFDSSPHAVRRCLESSSVVALWYHAARGEKGATLKGATLRRPLREEPRFGEEPRFRSLYEFRLCWPHSVRVCRSLLPLY